MDERVARLTTPEECEQFAQSVEAQSPELALEARRRAVELRAAKHGTKMALFALTHSPDEIAEMRILDVMGNVVLSSHL